MKRAPLLERTLSYPEIGATATHLPDGYDHLVACRVIGHGESTFQRATERLMSWDMHRAAGLSVAATTPRAEHGSRVLLRLGRHPVKVTFACQVVYVLSNSRRQGFAYGTLQGHPERGEERFCIDWREDDTVSLTITAFSRPGTWWSLAVSPISRRIQQQYTHRYLHAL